MRTGPSHTRVPLAGAIMLACCLASTARAQEAVPAGSRSLVVSCDKGRMTIVADSVALRTIIQEWARVGGVRLVNPQYVSLVPVSVDLRNLPEGEALEVLLRALPGYMLQQRSTESGGASVFEKLAVMAPPAAGTGRPEEWQSTPGLRAAHPGQPAEEAPDDPLSPPAGEAPPADGAFIQPQGPTAAGAGTATPGMVVTPAQARPGLPVPGRVLPVKDTRSERQ